MSQSSGVDNKYLVETTYGPVIGAQRTSFLGTDFLSFQSIPYAKPPVGDLRFRDPQPPEAWTTPLDATRPPVSSLYVDSRGVVAPGSSEDCLLLNVYTKQTAPTTPYPVIVWIHGGGFKIGSSTDRHLGPDLLLQKDVVVVTINYRLGALGFASLDDPRAQVPGNAGLKDQTLALRWVRANIASFGGDAHNVTVAGNSAGAGSAHLHMLSPHSSHLFDKAILQSGSAHCDWANWPKNNWTRRLAEKLGWTGEGGDEAVYAFLRDADAADIVLKQDSFKTMEELLNGMWAFGPATESYVAEQSFFTVSPRELAASQVWSHEVPVIIGGVSDEGLTFVRVFDTNPAFFQTIYSVERTIPYSLGIATGSDRSMELAQQIKEFYYQDRPIGTHTQQIWGDRMFWMGAHDTVVSRLSKNEAGATYVYRFAVDSELFVWKKLQAIGKYLPGTCHADEVLYLFNGHNMIVDLAKDSVEWRTIQRMVGLWTQFAATGSPNGGAELGDIQWDPVTDATVPLYGLHINNEDLRVDLLPETERTQFWDKLIKDNQ